MNDVSLPFELPPPAQTPSRHSTPSTREPADEQPPTPRQDTDLPLSLRGNGGSSRRAVHAAEAATLGELLDHLDRLTAMPAAPSLADTDWRVVKRWAEAAAEGLVSRREGLKLVRQVERVLADETHTAMRIRHAEERVAQRQALAWERAAGTHWKRRDAGRRAKQPTHVDVDASAWRKAKMVSATKGMTVGHYVGTLVRAVVDGGFPEIDECASTSHTFARVDVDKPIWAAFKARCYQHGVSAARGVGLVTEAAIRGAMSETTSRR